MKHIRRFNEGKKDVKSKYDIIDSIEYKKIKKKITDYYFTHKKEFEQGFFTKEYFNTIVSRLNLDNIENKELLKILKGDLMDILN